MASTTRAAGSTASPHDSAAVADRQIGARDHAEAHATSAACSHALAYAAIGWHVFPCRPDKKPHTEHGFLDASTDPEQVRAWWRRWPDAQIGVACGASGIVVVDLDVADGVDGRAALASHLGADPHCAAVEATTPRGGRHLFYLNPERRFGSCTAALGGTSGVDVRGVGGYAILPADGANGREWIGDDPRDEVEFLPPPPRVVEFLPPAGVGPARKGRGKMAPAGTATDDRLREVERHLRALDPSMPRAGWLRAIFAVHAALDADERGAELVEEWSSCTTVPGQYVPGEPSGTYSVAVLPWHAKKGPQLVDAETLFFMAKQAGYKEPAPALPKIEIAGAATRRADGLDRLRNDLAQRLTPGPDGKFANGSTWDPDAPPPKVDPAKKAASDVVLTDWRDLLTAPPVEYLIEGWIPEAATAVFAGAPTAGKSLQVVDWMMRLAHGMTWRGNAVQPCSCLYLCGEGHQGIAARLRAWSLQHSPGPSDRYVMVSNRIPAIDEEGQGERVLAAMLDMLADSKGHPPGLVIVDTLSQAMAGGDENGSDVVPLLNNLAAIRNRFACTTMAVHHLRKQAAKPANGERQRLTLDDVRGSGAIVGNVDTVLGAERVAGPDVEVSVLKQKDGAAGIRSLGSITVVETNVARRNGRIERSAIIVAAPDRQEQSEELRLAMAAEAMARAVTEALQAMGGHTTSRDAIYARVSGKTDRKRAGVAEAIARGWLRPCQPSDRGLEVTDAGLAVCSTHTHTRPLKGAGGAEGAPADAGASAPDQGADEGRKGAEGRNLPGRAGTPDEGQPEQPRGRRRRKAGGAA